MVNHPAALSAIADIWQQDRLRLASRERANVEASRHARHPRCAPLAWAVAAVGAILIVIGLVAAPGVRSAPINHYSAYTPEEQVNVEIAQRFFAELHDEGNLAVAEEIVAPEARFHIPGGELSGPEGIGGLVTMLRTAFPDAVFPMEDVVVDGDTVAVRWTMRGTSLGDFQGIPPTGEPVELRGTAFLRFADGQIVEDWVTYNQLGLLQQLGAMSVAE